MAKLTVDNGTLKKYSGDVTELTIPEGITSIESGVFAGHAEIININLPKTLTRIGDNAFYGCSGLMNIIIPGNVTSIGNSAFSRCSGLRNINIPDNVNSIGKDAFSGCIGLTDIIIPHSVTIIEDRTFIGCIGLTNINIPDSVTSIGQCAYKGCIGLTDLTIPDSVIRIGWNAFEGCSGLTRITIPNGITKIEWGAFKECSGLTEIVLPESLKEIGTSAFENCSALKNIYIPDSVKSVAGSAFSGCKMLIFNGSPFLVIGNSLDAYTGQFADVIIPENVTRINGSAFEGHDEMLSVRIPSGVTDIQYYAFRYCSGLSSITLPENLTEIGGHAFEGCTGLTELLFPDGITNFDMGVISSCSKLVRISLPASIKKLTGSYIPDNLEEIIIDSQASIEKIWNPDYFLEHEYNISPCVMFPITAIEEPASKIKFFFEYCKAPEKYPTQIAEGYEKYGRSQRSRILREAEAQNRTEVIDYYEKKGKKASAKTLTPAEKATLMQEAVEKGSDEDLLMVLNKYKNTGSEPSLLEKAVREGKTSKTRILLDRNIKLPERTDCFSELLKSSTILYDEKKTIMELCLSHGTESLSLGSDFLIEFLDSSVISYEEKKSIIELCLSHDLIWDTNGLGFIACILDYDEIIILLKKYKKITPYLKISEHFFFSSYQKIFEKLSVEQCRQGLGRILALCDPGKKPVFCLDETDSESIWHPETIRFIIENFSIKYARYVSTYAGMIRNAVKNNQPDSLRILLEYLEDKKQELLEDFQDSWHVRESIGKCITSQSKEMLKVLSDAGWVEPLIKQKDHYYTRDINEWKTQCINDAITGGDPELLQMLLDNGLNEELPSSFNKTNALRTAVNADNPGALEILANKGWIRNAPTRDSLIELASNEKKTNALAWLLEYKNKTANPIKEEKAKEKKERKALDDIGADSVQVSDSKKKEHELWKTRKTQDGTYAIERYLGTENSLTIPSKIGRRTITAIGEQSFAPHSYSSMKNNDFYGHDTSIIISDGIKTIEDKAFYGFDHLTSVVIPESVTTIGSEVFKRDIDYENDRMVIYGKKGSIIEEYADVNGLNFVSIDNSEQKIPDYVISKDTLVVYNGNDKNPVIPKYIKKIGKSVFLGKNEIESITLPEGLMSIGNNAFENCSGITNLFIPNSVTNIGDSAFSGCSRLSEITIPDSVTNIGDNAFSGCCELNGITLPSGLAKIGYNTFNNCKRITNIIIPEGVKKIEASSFSGCCALERIAIPKGITSIDYCTFDNCSGLTEVSIPEGVTKIDWNAFDGCKSLKEISIPNSVKSIGERAFQDCSGLNKIILPNGVISIGWGAFSGCSGLMSVVIPDSVTSIGGTAFYRCSGLTDITIPGSVSKIERDAFSNCSGLQDVIISSGFKSLDFTIFSGCTVLEKIAIPSTIKSLSVKFDRWKKWPEKLMKIVIDPEAVIEKVDGAEELIEHDFEISPVRMIPISAIEEPETKLRYFFEYCKAPNQYPAHVAESYIKYGKAQRSRILREATAQNQTQTIAYFEKELE